MQSTYDNVSEAFAVSLGQFLKGYLCKFLYKMYFSWVGEDIDLTDNKC